MSGIIIPTPHDILIPDIVIQKISQQKGLVLLSGPFNSGRTTALVSLLQHMNQTVSKRIVTLERPVEYLLVNNKSLINQREIGKDLPSYSHGIRNLLDEDVDVVALTELLEPDIQELVITLAESGKMVIAIMNAVSAISAIEQFIDGVRDD